MASEVALSGKSPAFATPAARRHAANRVHPSNMRFMIGLLRVGKDLSRSFLAPVSPQTLLEFYACSPPLQASCHSPQDCKVVRFCFGIFTLASVVIRGATVSATKSRLHQPR